MINGVPSVTIITPIVALAAGRKILTSPIPLAAVFTPLLVAMSIPLLTVLPGTPLIFATAAIAVPPIILPAVPSPTSSTLCAALALLLAVSARLVAPSATAPLDAAMAAAAAAPTMSLIPPAVALFLAVASGAG